MKNAISLLILLSLTLFSCQKEEYANPINPLDEKISPLDEHTNLRPSNRPFKGKMKFTSVSRTFDGGTVVERWEGSGRFTHLGNSSIVIHQFVTAGQLSGTIELTAANGDQLFLDYSGGLTSLDPVTYAFTSAIYFTFNGGTGRFIGAEGSGFGTGSGVFPNFPPGPNDIVTVNSIVGGRISY